MSGYADLRLKPPAGFDPLDQTVATPGNPYVITDFSLSNKLINPMFVNAANPTATIGFAPTGMEINTLGPQTALGRNGSIYGCKFMIRAFPDSNNEFDYEMYFDRFTQLAVVGEVPQVFFGTYWGAEVASNAVHGVGFGAPANNQITSSMGDLISLVNANTWNGRASIVQWVPFGAKPSGKINIRYQWDNTLNAGVSSYMVGAYRYVDEAVGPGYSAWQQVLNVTHYQWNYGPSVQGFRPIMGMVMAQCPQAGYRVRFTTFKINKGRIYRIPW